MIREELMTAINSIEQSRRLLVAFGQRVMNVMFEEEVSHFINVTYPEQVDQLKALAIALNIAPPSDACNTQKLIIISEEGKTVQIPELDVDAFIDNIHMTTLAISAIRLKYVVAHSDGIKYHVSLTVPLNILADDEKFFDFIMSSKSRFVADIHKVHDLLASIHLNQKAAEELKSFR